MTMTATVTTLRDLLTANGDTLTDADLAALADWAGRMKYAARHSKEWQRPYSLLREGADLTLRRRAQRATHPESPVTGTNAISTTESKLKIEDKETFTP